MQRLCYCMQRLCYFLGLAFNSFGLKEYSCLPFNGFEKNVSENLLIGENMEMIQANPTTDVKQMVIHRATNPSEILQNVRFKANLTKGVDADARILIVRKQFI